MLTARVATTTENIATATTSGFVNFPTSLTGSQIASPKMIALALVMRTPIAANANIVVGSATTWPTTCSFWLRPKRVKSGMLSDSVAQKPIIAVSDGMKTGKNSRERAELAGLREERPDARSPPVTAHTRRTSVTTRTYGAAQFSTLRRRSMPR